MSSNRTLVIGTRYLGENVLTHSLIQNLYSDGRKPIDYLTNSLNAEVAELMPEIDKVHIHDFKSGKLEYTKRKLIGKKLQEIKYKYAYVIPNHFKLALIPYFAKIPNIIGYKKEFRGFLLTDARNPYSVSKLEIAKITALAFEPNQYFTVSPPQLKVSNELITSTLNKFKININIRTIVISPGAGTHKPKIWSCNNFSKLIKLLSNDKYNFILLGTVNDVVYAKRIQENLNNPNYLTDLTGKTSIKEAAAIIKVSFATISNDSGLMHLSAALDRITLGIFLVTDPEQWKPQGFRSKYICNYENDLTVNAVYRKFNNLLETVTPYSD